MQRVLAVACCALVAPADAAGAVPEALVTERSSGRLVCRSASTAETAAFAARPGDAPVHVLARSRESLEASAGLHIVVRGTAQLEAHPEAKAVFLRAAARWESLIASPVTIVIDVDYGATAFGAPFDPGVGGWTFPKFANFAWTDTRTALLGNSSGKEQIYRSLPSGPIPTDIGPISRIGMSAAVFRAIGLLPAVEDPAAEQATLGNPTRIALLEDPENDLDPTDGIGRETFDFDGLVTHEIGHALGFVGGTTGTMSLMEVFSFPASATPPDLATTTRKMTVGGNPVFFAGGEQVVLSNGRDFGRSHWKWEPFTARTIGVMEPQFIWSIRGVVTSRDLAVLDAIGWKLSGANPVEPTVRTIPIVLDAGGVGGVRFSTELTLANRSGSPANVELAYSPAHFLGASGGGSATTTISAFSQTLIPDAFGWLRDHGVAVPTTGNQGGMLAVTFRGDATPDAFYAGARTTSPAGGGRAGLAYPAIREFDGLKGRSYLYGLRENAADRSNLALLNMGSAPVTLRVTLRPGSGNASATLPDVPLEPGQWTQLSRVLAGPGYASGWATIDLVSGSGPYGAYAVFNDNATNDGSYVPAAADPLPAEGQLVPVIVETSAFSSELVLTNPAATAATVTLKYVESGTPAAGAGGTATIPLGAYEQSILPSAVDWLRTHGVAIGPKGATYAGTVAVTFSNSSGVVPGLAGARTAAPGDGGAYGLFTPAEPLVGYAWDTWVFGLKQDATTRSNLAVVNTGVGPNGDAAGLTTLHVEVFDGTTGLLAGRTPSFALTPGGWTQFGAILAGFGVTNGFARIVYDAGNGWFTAYGVVNDGATPTSGGTNDGSYIAASKR